MSVIYDRVQFSVVHILMAAYTLSPLHSFICRVESHTGETQGVNRKF